MVVAEDKARSLRCQEQRRLVQLERQFLPFLLVSLLPVVVMPWANPSGTVIERLMLPFCLALLVIQSIRTLPVISPSPAAVVRVALYRLLGLLAALGIWVPLVTGGWSVPHLRVIALLAIMAFCITTSVRLMMLLARVPRVNLQVLAGAAAGYVHLGLTGGMIATVIQVIKPGSFNLGAEAHHDYLLDRLTYFSFITLGGLGYGDVVPANPIGERLAIFLSLSSTLYMSLLVGLLLGRFIAMEELELIEEQLDNQVLASPHDTSHPNSSS